MDWLRYVTLARSPSNARVRSNFFPQVILDMETRPSSKCGVRALIKMWSPRPSQSNEGTPGKHDSSFNVCLLLIVAGKIPKPSSSVASHDLLPKFSSTHPRLGRAQVLGPRAHSTIPVEHMPYTHPGVILSP